MQTNNPALVHVLTNLAACRAALASRQTISGRRATGLMLPPADEDPDPAARIAMYERWLARHAPEEATDG
jgi:hypothetical protein